MSFNRENVIWQSPDGTWNRGFFDSYSTGSYDDDDYDPEWDVEYSENFCWASTGHPTQQAAERSWSGANPGGQSTYPYSDDTQDDIAGFEVQAALLARAKSPTYFGPKKQVPLGYVAERVYGDRASVAVSTLNGYSNTLPRDHGEWEADLADRLPDASPSERSEVIRQAQFAAQKLADAISSARQSNEERRNQRPWGSPRYSAEQLEDAEKAFQWHYNRVTALRQTESPARQNVRAATERAKTTPKSTAGSFAPKGNSAPEVGL